MTTSSEQYQAWAQEWQVQQTQFDAYERMSLLIKLVSLLLVIIAFVMPEYSLGLAVVIAVVWLQDAIWKTYQSRIDDRLAVIEKALSQEATTDLPFQFNREFLATRPSQVGLMLSYLKQACRPTVAYPHVVLIGFTLVMAVF